MASSPKVYKVIISSTIVDLGKHRSEVKNACLRQTMFPLMMELRPASADNGMTFSLNLVNDADIYVGIFAHRYGWIPEGRNPEQISLTEMEYDRAVERGIPRLIFIIDKKRRVKVENSEQGQNSSKLNAFLEKVRGANFVNSFTSPKDLRSNVINSLADCRLQLEKVEAKNDAAISSSKANQSHPGSDIPALPETYIAHPYTLLQTHGLIGRQKELKLLTDWVAKPNSEIFKSRIVSIAAIGGMGKSALTWKWFNEIAPREMKPLAGRIWWSFYESDASFENFVIRALAYVSGRPIEEIRRMSLYDRESALLSALDHAPFLIVLDGLERILVAYNDIELFNERAADDDDDEAERSISNAYGVPASAREPFTVKHRLRKAADPLVGVFLKKLSMVRATRTLISSRLFPADLETNNREPIDKVFPMILEGLTDSDALQLWREYKVTGSRRFLISLFERVENHPLLIQSLAGEVSQNREDPGDFDKWIEKHKGFDPFNLPLVQVKSHVLSYALSGLDKEMRDVLYTIAAFRIPERYDTLAAVSIGKGKACSDAGRLDEILTELEDRGLIGWDRRANKYDLHPIVRGVVWSSLGDETKLGVYNVLHDYFASMPAITEDKVTSLEDLNPAIELFNTLIGMGRFDDAGRLFKERLNKPTLWRLNASILRIGLLELLFPDGLEELPRQEGWEKQAFIINSITLAYKLSGQPGRAIPLYTRHNSICRKMNDRNALGVGLINLSETLRQVGKLYESESVAREALIITRSESNRKAWIFTRDQSDSSFIEAGCLQWLGLVLATRGQSELAKAALERSRQLMAVQNHLQMEGVTRACMAQSEIWLGRFAEARYHANRAWEIASIKEYEGDFIRAARMQGEAALGLSDLYIAERRLHHTLTRARAVSLVEEEVPTLIAFAELRRRQGNESAAREFLSDAFEFIERGPYPIFYADALNVLAQIESDAGNRKQAVEAARRAILAAWCNGSPYSYYWGVSKAQIQLKRLAASVPRMKPFFSLAYEEMPDVEIDV
jgi:tetratricopeptide (TPR) repeat protein